jgi:5'-3' exonuclease/transcription antitermination factor NusG
MAEWVVLELSPKAEGENPDFIRTSIRHQIRDAEVYIPCSVTKREAGHTGENTVVVNWLVDGYAFIKRVHPDDKYFRLEGSRYVQAVISNVGRGVNGRPVRQLACATDADIDRFRQQIHTEENQGIGVGDLVVVTSGPYRQIQARVLEDIPEKEEVSVHIKLRSKEDIVTLPRSFLRLVERAPKSPYLDKVEALRSWFEATKPYLMADTRRFAEVINLHSRFQGLDRLFGQRRPLDAFFDIVKSNLEFREIATRYLSFSRLDRVISGVRYVRAVESAPASVTGIREQGAHVARLHGWEAQWKTLLAPVELLHGVLQRAYSPRSFDTVQDKFVTWAWHEDLAERLGALKHELEGIEREMIEPLGQVDMVIVDGHNLAFRCATVPGLDTLKDSQGRYTGAIVGVLRSLGSFRKKFPGAEIVVTWDGSSQRRKALFPAYKANRHSHTNGHANGAAASAPAEGEAAVVPVASSVPTNGLNGASPFNQIYWLRDVLPSLGVKQAWNPEEEADDVIATLVRQYPEKKCVVISTDRDLLQLVSHRVQLLVPGPKGERFFDPAAVEAEYGVRPEHMVDLRAIDGDTSDNIPGVPGFGLKTATKLLRLYGTVEGVYTSNFAGVTPAQYQRLREAEKQVRLNVQLMSLHHDVPLTVVDPDPNQIAAEQRLKDVEVRSEPILAAMLPVG